MTEEISNKNSAKKTPADASEFEREQLRFLLSGDDVAVTLARINPSLAWLPILWEMGLIKDERQLVAWIERNLASADAVREVVANLKFFGPETANFLQLRLTSEGSKLPPLLARCWKFIIRHMRSAKRGLAHNEWFDLLPELRRGEHDSAILEQLANVLRPHLRVSKRYRFYDTEETKPEKPSDLMSVDFKIDDNLPVTDVLDAWPKSSSPEADASLLSHLTSTLEAALADAIEVGIENDEHYGASDSDVPSVADHAQNEYHGGFQILVRVIAEIWTRVACKSPSAALAFVKRWRQSEFRLVRRIAMFAAVDQAVPADVAVNMLITLPLGELIRTGASVEFYRLLRGRWNEFPPDKQQQILHRICEGPPRDTFQEGPEGDRAIDRYRFDILSQMESDGFATGEEGKNTLHEIQSRWPQWTPKPEEQAGFHVWHSGGYRSRGGDPAAFASLPEDQLVAEIKKAEAQADFLNDDKWQGLCLSEPDRAFRGLSVAAEKGEWPVDFWQQLLFSPTVYASTETEDAVARILPKFPDSSFADVAGAASRWLESHAKGLPDEMLWPIWDKIAATVLIETAQADHA